jgi:hypothetical protein
MLLLALALQVSLDAAPATDHLAERRGRLDTLRQSSPERAALIDEGLGWLLAHQEPDGSFDADGFERHDPPGKGSGGAGGAERDAGATALAALALLGAGAEPGVDERGDAVARAIGWLAAAPAPEAPLDRAIVAAALCDAAAADEAHRGAAEAALARIESDASVASDWLLTVYRAARSAGIEIPAETVEPLETLARARGNSATPPEWSSRGKWSHEVLLFDAWRAFEAGEEVWESYRPSWETTLVRTRRRGGSAKFSWDPDRVGAEEGGRVWATAALVLAAEAGVRWIPPVEAEEEGPDLYDQIVGVGSGAGGVFGSRRNRGILRRASPELDGALTDALNWLAAQQQPRGSFGAGDESVETTALALLALMGGGSTSRSGAHREQIAKGIAWLRSWQNTETGAIQGADPRAQAMAAIVLAEAYTGARSPLLQGPAMLAVEEVLRRIENDVYVEARAQAWAALAVCAAFDAELGFGNAALAKAADLVLAGGDDPALLFPRILLEAHEALPADAALAKAEAKRLSSSTPRWGADVDLEAWHWDALAAFQFRGKPWRTWDKGFQVALIMGQQGSGEDAGSWSGQGNLVRATAFGALCAETWFRYARVR